MCPSNFSSQKSNQKCTYLPTLREEITTEVECHIQLIRYGVENKNGKFKIKSFKLERW
jgi:hypothetical protein